MAGICYSTCVASSFYHSRMFSTIKCCSNPSSNSNSKKQTPQLLKFAVNGVTEVLRLFSSVNNNRMEMVVSDKEGDSMVSGVDDVLDILKLDYDNAYFVTGSFTSSIYSVDCLFEDPTIKFQGRDLYSRNLKLLVPFFEQPSIVLKSIEKVKYMAPRSMYNQWLLSLASSINRNLNNGISSIMGIDAKRNIVLANWSLRTYLKLPWRPLIAIEGSTRYDLNYEYKIVRHVERWNVSAVEAVGQIFTPGFRRPLD